MSIEQQLSTPLAYEKYISKLHEEHAFSAIRYTKKQDGVTLAQFFRDKKQFALWIAEQVKSRKYDFSPFVERVIMTKNKKRICYDQTITDRIVSGVIVDVLRPYLAPLLSPRLYSHQPGCSHVDAIFDLAAYTRQHKKSITDPKQRGLYVLQTDIKSYEDSIDMRESSLLWGALERVFEQDPLYDSKKTDISRFVRRALRPHVVTLAKQHCTHLVGAPLGTPQNSLVNSLYGMIWDEYLDSFPGAFYARYSDDILFISPNANTVHAAMKGLEPILAACRLSLHPKKTDLWYWTACGKKSPSWPQIKPAQDITYLGISISFQGETMLTRPRISQLCNEVRNVIRSSLDFAFGMNLDEKTHLVCGALSQTLTGFGLVSSTTDQAHDLVTARSHLKQLDYLIARSVATAITGVRGARAFRQLPLQDLRDKFGLVSLLNLRNRGHR